MSEDEAGASAAEDDAAVVDGPSASLRAEQELAERNALAMVFDDVRAQSAASELVRPSRWVETGVVPAHLTAEDFEMLVYEYWEGDQVERAETEPVPLAAPVFRTATRAVGVPRLFGSHAVEPKPEAEPVIDAVDLKEDDGFAAGGESGSEGGLLEEPASTDQDADRAVLPDDPFANLKIPAGYRLVELEGQYVLVEDEDAPPVELVITCENITALVGAHSYYLYDSSIMTDAYAHWAFLSAEDDDVVTFVDCVREDSRIYPRPFAASSLKNPPFNMTDQDIAQAWDGVRESEEYPDIEQTTASNGDAYFYSTRYLSAPYAASLAEWDAVERRLCL